MWSTAGHTSRINFVCGTAVLLTEVKQCYVGLPLGDKSQVVRSPNLADHRPVVVELRILLKYVGKPKIDRWDFDRIAEARAGGPLKQQLVEKIEAALAAELDVVFALETVISPE